MTKSKKNQSHPVQLTIIALIFLGVIIAVLLHGKDVALLNPKGLIAAEQYRLLLASTFVMVGFAAPVLFFLYFFAWRYRETNQKTQHDPTAGRSKGLLITAWASPIFIFVVLAALMLPATQKLEPQRAIASDNEEITIRVVAMRWKWLFMYPEQDVAAVNFVQIPVDTPVRFELTADEAPMNSFWIPHLGGMLYSMTEHVNPLNLMADTIGDYDGGAAEINGHGFSGMRFTARVSSRENFDAWVKETAASPDVLDEASYARLLEPSEYDTAMTFSSPTNQALFSNLLQKYAGSHGHYSASEDTEHEVQH